MVDLNAAAEHVQVSEGESIYCGGVVLMADGVDAGSKRSRRTQPKTVARIGRDL